MDGSNKRTKEDEFSDRISHLPNSLIDCILDRVPLRDAVRTSVLSRKWRHQWTRVANLVFDKKFLADLFGTHYAHESANFCYTDIIGSFLLLHDGPIRKFVLNVPHFDNGPPVDLAVGKWIRAASCRDVKEVSIFFNSKSSAKLSSYIFHCLEVRHLGLANCKFEIPYNFRGFANLVSLQLDRVSINGDGLSNLLSKCPRLVYLSLFKYVGPLTVSAPRLKTLRVEMCGINGLFSLQNLASLVTVSFRSTYTLTAQSCSIIHFFGLMPKIVNISLNSLILSDFARQHVPKMLPTPLECHRDLTLLEMSTSVAKDMSCALCILRSSPYLQTLNISITNLVTPTNEAEEEAGFAFLKEHLSELTYPNTLRTVRMKGLMGTRTEIMLLKSLLTSCAALETLYVNAGDTIPSWAELKMMSELMTCQRASSKAVVKYSKGDGINAVSYSEDQVDSSIFEF